jgi:DNA-binding LytR/AlgR family response regulator
VKVEIKVSEETTLIKKLIKEAYAGEKLVLIENEFSKDIITVLDGERIKVLRPEEIYMTRIENEKTVVYARTEKYNSNKRLYEMESILGSGFMRISKSVLVNLKYLECVEPSLGGVMLLVLKNGCKDYISRKYLPAFKKYLGI